MSVIRVQDLYKRYSGHTAVNDVSFSVERGQIFGIIGPNGAGKTTIVECIAGLRKPDRGHIRVLGLDPQLDRQELHERVGIQLQASQLPDKLKVWEALDLYASFYKQPADWIQLIQTLGLNEKRNTMYEKLSGGQKQRLSIALALIGSPEILILDELTTGLDPQARRDTWQLIKDIQSRGVTILLVTHFMDEAERLCDRLVMIDLGRVVALDTPDGIVSLVQKEQRIRFRPSVPLDERLLARLPEVHHVSRTGSTLVVSGSKNLLQAVSALLADHRIIAHELHIEQMGLDDAFIALTANKT